jgi:4-carboxymuconolactone decarboxylase
LRDIGAVIEADKIISSTNQEAAVTADERYEKGMTVRRAVLGDAWVDRSLKKRNAFNTEFQEMITRNVWGEIWTRPGLDRKTRRCMVIASMIALGRWEEFKLHVRAALNDDITPDEIKEIILQSAMYCGVPAGNHAIGEAEQVLVELGLLDSNTP